MNERENGTRRIARAIPKTKTNRRTRFWDDQEMDGLYPIPDARPRKSERRMETPHPGLQHETNMENGAGQRTEHRDRNRPQAIP